jgi:hypothetical protein
MLNFQYRYSLYTFRQVGESHLLSDCSVLRHQGKSHGPRLAIACARHDRRTQNGPNLVIVEYNVE